MPDDRNAFEELDLRGVDRSHRIDPSFRAELLDAALKVVANGEATTGKTTTTRSITMVDLETSSLSRPTRRRRLALIAAAAAAAVIGAVVVVATNDDNDPNSVLADEPTAPADATATPVPPTPTATPAPPTVSSVERLGGLALTGEDLEDGWASIGGAVDLATHPDGLRPYMAEAPSCEGLIDILLPYETAIDGARIDFANATTGSTGWIELITMPDEPSAVAYMEQLRSDDGLPACLSDAVVAQLAFNAGPTLSVEATDPRYSDPIENYGDDQVVMSSDLFVTSGPTEVTITAGGRFSRIGNLILVVNGAANPMDRFAATYYEKVQAAIANG
jgi:hypothetical protein